MQGNGEPPNKVHFNRKNSGPCLWFLLSLKPSMPYIPCNAIDKRTPSRKNELSHTDSKPGTHQGGSPSERGTVRNPKLGYLLYSETPTKHKVLHPWEGKQGLKNLAQKRSPSGFFILFSIVNDGWVFGQLSS